MVDLNENNAGDVFRAGLSADSPRPPRVNIAEAMRAGRRVRTVRRASVAGGVGLAVLVAIAVPAALAANRNSATPPPGGATPSASATGTRPSRAALPPLAPPTSCTAENVPAPSGASTWSVTAASPDGKIIYGQYIHGRDSRVWRVPKLTAPIPPDDQYVSGVNNDGLAVGFGNIDVQVTAWTLRGNQVTPLPGGVMAYATGVNAAGQVIGSRGSTGPGGHPIVWRDTAAAPADLPLPEGAYGGEALAIADDGTVVGAVTVGLREYPYAWGPDNTGRPLAIPPGVSTSPNAGTEPGPLTLARQVSGPWATGVAGLHLSPQPVRWNLDTGVAEVIPGLQGKAVAGNGRGWVAGVQAGGKGVLLAGDQRVVLGAGDAPVTVSEDGRTIAVNHATGQSTTSAKIYHCT
ncbi:hypothetical protein Dvina_52430 [Dactylosporangium vinaceum]|uniref:Uncharacterized protein n=1 Tax=Dactylosporangium vinaceum TaxID=53362 RepID=A0ABV5MQK6_9ACTN|nr:hypothetical protein [Dactylosporangium vinaceum]UAB96437.1 hypothetical protein Dvina_52430 [Dactylosporangium vinaceum]